VALELVRDRARHHLVEQRVRTAFLERGTSLNVTTEVTAGSRRDHDRCLSPDALRPPLGGPGLGSTVLLCNNGLAYTDSRSSFRRLITQYHFVYFTVSLYKCDNGCCRLFAAGRLHCASVQQYGLTWVLVSRYVFLVLKSEVCHTP